MYANNGSKRNIAKFNETRACRHAKCMQKAQADVGLGVGVIIQSQLLSFANAVSENDENTSFDRRPRRRILIRVMTYRALSERVKPRGTIHAVRILR